MVSEPVLGLSEDSVRSPLVPTPSKPESSSPSALSNRSSLPPAAGDSALESDMNGGGADDDMAKQDCRQLHCFSQPVSVRTTS